MGDQKGEGKERVEQPHSFLHSFSPGLCIHHWGLGRRTTGLGPALGVGQG